ncbi:aminotransferase class I/II-fold pyridoxal phosphate-dependent enzyme [Rhodoferax aquaticus]|uniref:histidinol-phosphate transaminase n=1 Tax=Rhodoferax aquaticus TaxID=2527691 RepID=A0A515EN89_9BURK|nr:aminotransferase class I/II-fold pyridoxal phosphate-dependent enzyme [Rhodoferax aquaticus]QDL54129.1 aminotransferase class I/II-fold pyridoxal phosphate-dependent enzyme [Rhodoferax aquaticus]
MTSHLNPGLARVHGGTDALGTVQHDFSTNSNACGPCPAAVAAVQAADATRYPDSTYTALRTTLAAFHGVDAWRIVLAASASEFIFRVTAWRRLQGASTVHLPPHAYGDYAAAAAAWGLQPTEGVDSADLVWACEPSSPLGQSHRNWPQDLARCAVVLDCAYAPLRLEGLPSLGPAQRQQVWQLFSPNKALGLTGVRAAYAIAPLHAQVEVSGLEALAPSWPVGVHGVAMLNAWAQPATAQWLASSLTTLRTWKAGQISALLSQGWELAPSEANYVCARPPQPADAQALCVSLRTHGIKVRDATSFGLSGWFRLGVLSPGAVEALVLQLQRES